MLETANTLELKLKAALLAFEPLTATDWAYKPNPMKWSRKEILGHLIDSAQNNIQRMVRAQQTNDLHIVYNQNHWVRAHDYQGYEITELQLIWYYTNRQLAHLLRQIPVALYGQTLNMGSAAAPDFWTLEMVAKDYILHMEHHLKQILA